MSKTNHQRGGKKYSRDIHMRRPTGRGGLKERMEPGPGGYICGCCQAQPKSTALKKVIRRKSKHARRVQDKQLVHPDSWSDDA